MRKFMILPLLAAALTLQPTVAAAYIGPGLGAGAVAAVLGMLAAIGMAVVAMLWYPIKKLLKKRAPAPEASQGQ